MFNPKKSNFSDDSVQTEAFSLLKTLQRKPRLVAKFLLIYCVRIKVEPSVPTCTA